MTAKQEQAQRIMRAIRRILIDDWDPIGIKGSGPGDEYDGYIGGLYRLLTRTPTEDEVIEHLCSIDMTGEGSEVKNQRRLKTVARKLLQVDIAIN